MPKVSAVRFSFFRLTASCRQLERFFFFWSLLFSTFLFRVSFLLFCSPPPRSIEAPTLRVSAGELCELLTLFFVYYGSEHQQHCCSVEEGVRNVIRWEFCCFCQLNLLHMVFFFFSSSLHLYLLVSFNRKNQLPSLSFLPHRIQCVSYSLYWVQSNQH